MRTGDPSADSLAALSFVALFPAVLQEKGEEVKWGFQAMDHLIYPLI